MYFELFWEHVDSGNWELFIDGTSVGSASSRDMDGGSAIATSGFFGTNTGTFYYDDIYWLSGATAATDRLGGGASPNGGSGPEVFMYQNTAEDATDQGDTLDDGTWALVSEIPLAPKYYHCGLLP